MQADKTTQTKVATDAGKIFLVHKVTGMAYILLGRFSLEKKWPEEASVEQYYTVVPVREEYRSNLVRLSVEKARSDYHFLNEVNPLTV